MFTSLLFKGGIVLVLVTACLFFAWRIVRILNPRPPRPPKYTEYFVVEVRNGATIIVAKKIGKRGSRRTKSLNLEGIASPAEGEPWFAESRDNLALFAGAKVRVQVKGLFRSEKPDESFDMIWTSPIAKAWVLGGGPAYAGPDDKAFARDVAAFAVLNLRECLVCAKSHEYPCQCWLDRDDVFWEWYAWHLSRQRCTVCRDAWLLAIAEHNKKVRKDCTTCGIRGICLIASQYEPTPSRWCGEWTPQEGDLLEARDVIVGTVWGESGACLNLEQLKSGWAKTVGEIPEEWVEAEKEAKKAGTGMWK